MGHEQSVHSDLWVNEAEGTALSVIARRDPITRYELLRAFQLSPMTFPNQSKGSLYPLVRRLVERGFITTELGGGARNTEVLRLSGRGREALRLWVKSIGPALLLPHDPLNFRATSLGELSREERIAWIAAAKEQIFRKKEELADYTAKAVIPYGEILHPAIGASLDAKLQWLDRLLIKVLEEEEPKRRSQYLPER
jgi:DNA-binding PadR family transcriptional regulator